MQGWFEPQSLAEQFAQGWLFGFCHFLFLFCFHVLIIAKGQLLVNHKKSPTNSRAFVVLKYYFLETILNASCDTIAVKTVHTVLTILASSVHCQCHVLVDWQAGTNANQCGVAVLTSLVVKISGTTFDCNTYRAQFGNIITSN